MVYNTQRKLINALCDFEQVSKPFETVKMRAPKKPTGTSPELEKVFQTLLPKVKPDLEATRARNMEGYRTLRGEKKVVEGFLPTRASGLELQVHVSGEFSRHRGILGVDRRK
jgi:hypothetical protein